MVNFCHMYVYVWLKDNILRKRHSLIDGHLVWVCDICNDIDFAVLVVLYLYIGTSPGGGTPYVMGDTYVPRFWPPFFTLAGSSTIFLGYFFSSTNTKTIFWGIKTTNSYRIRSFRPQISFFPRSFWVQFSAASGTPPSFFGPSTPPGDQPLIVAPAIRLRADQIVWAPVISDSQLLRFIDRQNDVTKMSLR